MPRFTFTRQCVVTAPSERDARALLQAAPWGDPLLAMVRDVHERDVTPCPLHASQDEADAAFMRLPATARDMFIGGGRAA